MTKTQKVLESAGFIVHKAYPGGRWFEVTAPAYQEQGYVLRQSNVAWHFFSRFYASTASSSCVATCDLGGLGDAINTDSQMKTYKRLLRPENVPYEIRDKRGISAAMGQVEMD